MTRIALFALVALAACEPPTRGTSDDGGTARAYYETCGLSCIFSEDHRRCTSSPDFGPCDPRCAPICVGEWASGSGIRGTAPDCSGASCVCDPSSGYPRLTCARPD